MNSESLELLCCPKCKAELLTVKEHLSNDTDKKYKCSECGNLYALDAGLIQFINDNDVFKFSRQMEFFRSIYAALYTPLTDIMFIPCGGVTAARKEVLNTLEIKPHYKILETGIGTGDNIHALMDNLSDCHYYGLDNQLRMLKSCLHNTEKWQYPVWLCRANAEELPFKDNSFDVVFHLGAINLFENKKRAIDEMIRVAKPGTKIVIADESEKASKLFSFFVGHIDEVIPPVDCVCRDMEEVCLKEIWNGYGYIITFRKPAA